MFLEVFNWYWVFFISYSVKELLYWILVEIDEIKVFFSCIILVCFYIFFVF